MYDRIDHAATANDLLEPLDGRYSDFDRVQFVAQAQVHATMYLAEQQRIANLIALGEQWEPSVCFVCGSDPCDREGHAEHLESGDMRPEIREALGL